MLERVRAIAVEQAFACHLGIELVLAEVDHAVLRLPYHDFLGDDRVNGGAISSLVDLAATCAFWAHPAIGAEARGATIGFSINFLELVVAADLEAHARVRRRGGSICVGDVSVTDPRGREVALANVTYKLNP
ncbi:MAG: PaaI family thioesterase [Gammaproteobacteria bacterium]